MLCVEQKYKLKNNKNKNNTESRIENSSHTSREMNLVCFSSYKNHELKVKMWQVEAPEWEKTAFFVTFILSEGNFLYICVLSQCTVYWINFQNKHIKKHYLIHFFACF